MPTPLGAQDPASPLVLRRLAKEDLEGLAEVLPAALGGEAEPWIDAQGEDAWG